MPRILLKICWYFLLMYLLTLIFFKIVGVDEKINYLDFPIIDVTATLLFLLYFFYKYNNRLHILADFLFLRKFSLMLVGSVLLPVIIILLIVSIDSSYLFFSGFNINILTYLLIFIIFGAFEEIVFRYFLLEKVIKFSIFNLRILAASLLFALAHLANNGFTVLPFLVIFISGILLSLIYLKSGKNLVLLIMVHALWNFSSSNIIGGAVSGLTVKFSVLKFVKVKNNAINGGVFGIEGSFISLAVLFMIIILYLRNDWRVEKLNTYFNKKVGT